MTDAIQFEGRAFAGAEDVREALRTGACGRAQDGHPWEWVTRLCAAHPAARPWVEAALFALLRELPNGGHRPAAAGHDVFTTARLCQLEGFLAPLREPLRAPLDDWSDGDVRALLDRLLGMRPATLAPDEVARVRALGGRPGCFTVAFQLLAGLDPAAAAAFARDEAVTAVARANATERSWILHVLAIYLRASDFAAHRASVLAAFDGAPGLRRSLSAALREG